MKIKNTDIKAAIRIVTDAAKQYDERLKDRHFLVVYQEGSETKTVQLGFRDMNFLHLTGIKTTLTAKQFYTACLDHKLAEKDISCYTNIRKAKHSKSYQYCHICQKFCIITA